MGANRSRGGGGHRAFGRRRRHHAVRPRAAVWPRRIGSGHRRRVRRTTARRRSFHHEMPARHTGDRVRRAVDHPQTPRAQPHCNAPVARRSVVAALEHHSRRLPVPARCRCAGTLRHTAVDLPRAGDSDVRSADARRLDRQLGHHRGGVARYDHRRSAHRSRNRRWCSASPIASTPRAACDGSTSRRARATSSLQHAPRAWA